MERYAKSFKATAEIEIDKQLIAAEIAKQAELGRTQALRIKLILKGLGKATDTDAQWIKTFRKVQARKIETKEFGESLEWSHVGKKRTLLCTMPAGPVLDRCQAIDENGIPVPNTFQYIIKWPMF